MKLVNRAYGILVIIVLSSSNLFCQSETFLVNPDILSARYVSMHTQNDLNMNILGNYPNRPTIQLQLLWSIVNNCWENSSKSVTEYPNGKISTVTSTLVSIRTHYSWYGNVWNSGPWSETYVDDNGIINKFISYSSEGTPNQEIYYNPPYTNGQPATTLSLRDVGSGWENFWQASHTYNSDGDQIERIVEDWDVSTNSWVIRSIGVYTYVQPGCLADKTFYSDDNGSLNVYSKYTYTYGRTDCMSEMVPYQPWPLENYNPTQVLYEVSSDNGVTWVLGATYAYSDFGTDCLPHTNNYSNVVEERSYFEFTPIPGGKIPSTYDNSNLRCTEKTTQGFVDGSWVNTTKTWYSYEGLTLDTKFETAVPDGFALEQNYPNPFNPKTAIEFSLSEESNVNLSVYDLTGKLIKEIINTPMQIGNYNITWDGTDNIGIKVGAGVYIYKLQTDKFSESRKMILLK